MVLVFFLGFVAVFITAVADLVEAVGEPRPLQTLIVVAIVCGWRFVSGWRPTVVW